MAAEAAAPESRLARRDRILKAALDHVPFDGWSRKSLLAGTRDTGFDAATARAVAPLPVLLEYIVPLLEVGGVALLPKGVDIREELAAGRRAASREAGLGFSRGACRALG